MNKYLRSGEFFTPQEVAELLARIANLEAQLEERQKQYEYYRNKLLTFE